MSSFSFGRQLQIEPMIPPAPVDHSTSTPSIDITSPQETHILVDLEKSLPSSSEPPLSAPPLRHAATHQDYKAKVDREVWKIVLLNMYPVTYLILWLPGIANRIAEGMGHDVRWLVILQSSTQFIGLANAIVYLYKEHRRDVREWWAGIQRRRAAKAAKIENRGTD